MAARLLAFDELFISLRADSLKQGAMLVRQGRKCEDGVVESLTFCKATAIKMGDDGCSVVSCGRVLVWLMLMIPCCCGKSEYTQISEVRPVM